jgi:gliding motility-associated-like protein
MSTFVLRTIYFLVILSFSASMSQAQITASKTSGCAPLTVSFSAPAGMTTYYWDFDNGGSSEDANPNVVFTTPRNPYKVSLRACKTCPILQTIDIQVFPKPTITLPPIKGCSPLLVTFNPVLNLPSGVSASSLKYIFGDGNTVTKTAPNLTPANHTYSDPDKTYPVSFEIITTPSSAGCDHTIVIPGAVETSSIQFPWLSASPSADCNAPLTVSLTYNIVSKKPITSYEWKFGDGNTATTAQPSHTFTQKGVYTVSLTVKNEDGCEKTNSTTVTIKDNDMTKILSVDTVCINQAFTLNIDGDPNLQTRWTLGGGAIVFNKPATDYYSTPGLKTVSVTSYFPGFVCPKTISKQILAIDPKIEYTIVPMPLCNKQNTFTLRCTNAHLFDNIEWRLHFVRGQSDTPVMTVYGTNFTQTVTHTLNIDSTTWQYYKLVLKATATAKYGGCKAEMTDLNFISPLIAHVVPTVTAGCKPLRVGFYDKTTRYRKDTLVEWRLQFGDGTEVTRTSFNDTFYYTYPNKGDYNMRMIVKNKHGCLDTTYFTKIEVGDQHVADFTISPATVPCASDPNVNITLQSTVSPSAVQQTKFWVDGFRCVQWNNMTFKPKKPGLYPIKMEVVDRGCFSTVTKNITVDGTKSEFSVLQNCDSLNKVKFINQSLQADSFLWSFGDGQISKDTNPTHYYAKDSIYRVRLISYKAGTVCPADTLTQLVQIQTPRAKFSKDTYYFCHNDVIQTIDANGSKGYINDGINSGFLWDFKHGRAPTRTLDRSLNYDVHSKLFDTAVLTVRNFMDCKHSDTAVIYVDQIDLTYTVTPDTICNGDTVKYKGILHSLLPLSKEIWKFGDGDSANKLDTFHLFKFGMRTSNNFTSNFYAETTKGCKYTTSKLLIVKKLNLSLDPYSTNLCLQSATVPVKITSKVNPLYPSAIRWRCPDNVTRTGKTIEYSFTTTGSFNFHLIATDSSNSNCIDTFSPANVIVHKKPNLAITSDKDSFTVLCHPVNLDLAFKDSNNSIISFRKWTITDSTGPTVYNNNMNVSKSLNKGLNKVQFIANTAYCSDTVERNFIVRAPSGSMTIDKNDICKGEEITFSVKDLVDVNEYSIDFGDGFVSKNIPTIKHRYTYVPLGGKTLAKAIFSANGSFCIGKPTDTIIRIHEVFAKFSIDGAADTPICYRSVLIKDSSIGADKYFWNFGDGTTGTKKEPGMKTYPNPQKYMVSLAIESQTYGCKDTFLDSVELVPLPQSLPTNDTICQGATSKVYQLSAQKNVIYSWMPAGILRNNRTDSVYYNRDSSFQFIARAYDTMTKCSKEANGSVMVIRPMLRQTLDTTIAPGADIILPFSPMSNYNFTWLIDSFLSCTDCKDPTAQFLLSPIVYKVVFYDRLKNCFTDTSIYKINIFPDILVNAPTAFTPNGDGNNDIFYARGFGIKKLTSFKIYNRQGTLIFFSTSENVGWDGNYKDEPQNSDTYFYTIEGESYIPNKRVFKEGNFILLR